ncbi:DUF6890 family protein, partial [Escherichia coli]|uniref:DUF6890 family protein n=1 Tax=Escherichia coli TaxID=562 RepID=UPI003EE17CE5
DQHPGKVIAINGPQMAFYFFTVISTSGTNSLFTAAAVWLDNHYWENMSIAVNNGIIRAFKGS